MSVANIANSPEAQAFTASLAAKYGISQAAAQGAMTGLLPSLITGLEHNSMSRDGIANLMTALSSGNHDAVIADPAAVGNASTVADGNAIIGHLVGPAGLSQGTLQMAAGQAGVPVGLMKELGPAVAVFLMGWLFRNAGGMLGNVLGSATGGGGGMSMPQMPQMPPMGGAPTGRPMGSGGPALGLPDIRNFDTSGRNNPYGNIADSIRRGGSNAGQVSGGVRDILGGLLGFGSSSGWMGWIIKFLVLRFGMTILRGVLRGVIGGR